jgi:hypothetical protein
VSGTNSSTSGPGLGCSGDGGAGATGGDGTAGAPPSFDAEAPPICLLPQYRTSPPSGDPRRLGSQHDLGAFAQHRGRRRNVGCSRSAEDRPPTGQPKYVPFSDVNQQVLFAQAWPNSINLTGTMITARSKARLRAQRRPARWSGLSRHQVPSSAPLAQPRLPVNLGSSAGWTL